MFLDAVGKRTSFSFRAVSSRVVIKQTTKPEVLRHQKLNSLWIRSASKGVTVIQGMT